MIGIRFTLLLSGRVEQFGRLRHEQCCARPGQPGRCRAANAAIAAQGVQQAADIARQGELAASGMSSSELSIDNDGLARPKRRGGSPIFARLPRRRRPKYPSGRTPPCRLDIPVRGGRAIVRDPENRRGGMRRSAGPAPREAPKAGHSCEPRPPSRSTIPRARPPACGNCRRGL